MQILILWVQGRPDNHTRSDGSLWSAEDLTGVLGPGGGSDHLMFPVMVFW